MFNISNFLLNLKGTSNYTLRKAFSQGHYPVLGESILEEPEIILNILNQRELAMLNQLILWSINYRVVYITQERLGKYVGIGQRQARRILDTLDKLGLVRKRNRGFKKTCVYYVNKLLYKNFKVVTSLYHYLPSLKTLLLWTSFIYAKNPFVKANVLRENNIGSYIRNNHSLFVKGTSMRDKILKRFDKFVVLSDQEKIKLAGYPDESLDFAWNQYINHSNRSSIHSPFDYIHKIATLYCERMDLTFDDSLWRKIVKNIENKDNPEMGMTSVKEQSAHHQASIDLPISGFKNMAVKEKQRSTVTTIKTATYEKKEPTKEEKISILEERIARAPQGIANLEELIAQGNAYAKFNLKSTLRSLEMDKEELRKLTSPR